VRLSGEWLRKNWMAHSGAVALVNRNMLDFRMFRRSKQASEIMEKD